MCLKVYANGNGVGMKTHVSVFLYMMKGEYDDSLKWPFQGDITIQLLSQIEDDDRHRVRVLDNLRFGDRVYSGQRTID